LVVRKTWTKIIWQIVYSTIKGDKILWEANSQDLKKFGLTAGLKNFCASYWTGLLCARRLLKKLHI